MPSFAAQAPDHQRLFGRIAEAGDAKPVRCCLAEDSVLAGAPPACTNIFYYNPT